MTLDVIQGEVVNLLPETSGLILDVDATSGCDATWFADHDPEVVVVEPAPRLYELAIPLIEIRACAGSTTNFPSKTSSES